MIELLPIKLLTNEDARIFGTIGVNLAKLFRSGLPVGDGIAVTAPEFKLKTILEHFDFGSKEVFTQSLNLINREINRIEVPKILEFETKKQQKFLVNENEVKKVKNLWQLLLSIWMDQIKKRLWDRGFYPGITEGLEPQIVVFVTKIKSSGKAYFDPLQDDVEIQIKTGDLHPGNLKKIVEIVESANKKLFIPQEYEWILDREVKLVGTRPYTPSVNMDFRFTSGLRTGCGNDKTRGASCFTIKSAVKVFFELSTGFVVEKNVDGVYIDSGKIFDLNKPKDSFEDLVFKLVESAVTFPNSPIFFKLADKSEGMGTMRGALRLIHQKNLFEPLMQVLDFTRHKKGLCNIHVVIPFLRGINELLQIKRDLAVKKLSRKNSLEQWIELSVPENIINLESYLIAGVDGVILNMDELIIYLNGFDVSKGELAFYKNEVDGLLKFLENDIRLLHKSKIPFIAYGSLALYPKVLEFLVESGVWGVVIEGFEACSARDLLHQVEKRIVLRRT